MRKRITLILFVFLSLCSCAENTEQSTIANGVNPSGPSTIAEPSNVQALESYADVRGIDETKTLASGEYIPEDIRTYWFNENTIFEGNEALAAKIMEEGKAPGLNVSELHAQGITGENVTVAIIDQPLLLDHPEYAGKVEQYHTIGLTEEDWPSSMHGPAVTSLLAGNTIGTAPGVKLYYVAIATWERTAPEMGAQALNWLIEQNEALPEADKIRAVSVSADFTNTEYFDNHSAWDEAVKRAQDVNILVLDCRREYDTCVFWPSCFDPDNRDDLARCKIGTPDGDFQDCPQQAMGTPVGYRTTAEVYDENEYSYSYDAIGGHSWAIPYGTGILALGWQLNPSLTGQELIELMRQTAYQNASGDCFINPSAFIDSVPQTSGGETDGETYYGTDPWLNDPDNPESEKWRHSFITTAFFENGYNIRLAWNNPPSLYETTRQVVAGQKYTVSFIEETKEYADDPQVLEAIRLCILKRKQEEAEADGGLPEEEFLLTNPVVVDVDGPFEDVDQHPANVK